jgi:arylsulfatase A-like enzyme
MHHRLPGSACALAMLVPCIDTAHGQPRSTPGDGAPAQNVLIVLADDLGVDWVGRYGSPIAPPTPNLDRLAADGVTFWNAWSPPMCSPARACVQTGRYGFRNGVGSNVTPTGALALSELTLPEALDLAEPGGGAACHALFGKWHLGSSAVGGLLSPNLAGWGRFAGSATHAGALAGGEDYFHWTKVTDGVAGLVDAYVTTVNVDDALAWIGARSEPWLCMVALVSVHTPVHAPPSELHAIDLSGAGPPKLDPLPYMQAMIQAMDTEIGRLLAAVDPATTTVIFAADNGTSEFLTLPPLDPLHAKNSLYQGGIRVPMIVRGPGVAVPGAICTAAVHLVDVFPTALELAGAAASLPPELVLDGISLVPYLADAGRPSLRATAFSEVFQPNGAHPGRLAAPAALPFCQPDLGFAGPGAATLALCGDPMVVSAKLELAVAGVEPFAPIALVLSGSLAPTPLLGGTLAANPPSVVLFGIADAGGALVLAGLDVLAPGPFALFVQALALAPELPGGAAFTNAIRADYLAWDMKAASDGRFKLIADVHGGFQRLFDLELDPLEKDDLFAGPLSVDAGAAALALRGAIDALIAP